MSDLPKEVLEALSVITEYISNETGDDELSFVGATYENIETGKFFDVVVQEKSDFRILKENSHEMYAMLRACSDILKYCDFHNTLRDVDNLLAKVRGEL